MTSDAVDLSLAVGSGPSMSSSEVQQLVLELVRCEIVQKAQKPAENLMGSAPCSDKNARVGPSLRYTMAMKGLEVGPVVSKKDHAISSGVVQLLYIGAA